MPQTGFLDTKIEFLKGVGPARAQVLGEEYGIVTFSDLLEHYPFRYVDRTRFYKVREVSPQMPSIQLKGRITGLRTMGKQRAARLMARLEDPTGSIELIWFRGTSYIKDLLSKGGEFIVFGKPTLFQDKLNIAHPELEAATDHQAVAPPPLQALYPTTEKSKAKKLDSRALLRLQKTLHARLANEFIPDLLPAYLARELKLVNTKQALMDVHFPRDEQALMRAKFRLKFDEFFTLQLRMLQSKVSRAEKIQGYRFSMVGDLFNIFYKEKLPFELTGAQKKVIREIRQDTGTGKQMNRLVQGDVGCGKTLVAFMSMLLAIDNGYTACMMAPTEILARQHNQTIRRFCNDLGLETAILTGTTPSRDRKAILKRLSAGEIHILTGTHALIEDSVVFHKLGLSVIDEQHRFGVEQRARLWSRQPVPPHVLVMTATPIPRTLAMTLYGDLDVSVIDELPPGRKPVTTKLVFESRRLQVNGFIKKQIQAGRQVYIVYPLISESEKLDYKNLMEGYDALCRDFPAPGYRTSVVHGRMKPADREAEMKRFVEGKTQIMVATTVIEVGVDVPNATVMIIESAERFGLSQLHQLRGRVGRGADASTCMLMAGDDIGREARERLQTMVRTNDGFEIAETDLRLRGPGDIQGTQQSGIVGLKIADLGKDKAILELARSTATRILDKDPGLSLKVHAGLQHMIRRNQEAPVRWEQVS